MTVALFKLHGSVNWGFVKASNRELTSEEHLEPLQEDTSGIQEEVSLLPPGVGRDPWGRRTAIHYPYLSKSAPKHDIFEVSYSYLRSCLLNCKLCIVIGSSFRDKKILEAIVESASMTSIEFPKGKRQGQKWMSIPIRHEGNKIRILTIAPKPDHLLLQERLKEYPKDLPIEIIPFESKFGIDTIPAILKKIERLLP